MTAPPAAPSAPSPPPAAAPPEGQRSRALLVVGRTGLNAWGGTVTEEWLPQLRGARGIRVYREMSDNDSAVGALLFAIQMTMRQVPWAFEPASEQPHDRAAADFANSCLTDMEHSWDAFLVEALSFLAFGWSWHEVCYKLRLNPDATDLTKRSQFTDGFYGWRKLPIRSQDSWRKWVFNDEGDVVGMVQAAPPDYRPVELPRAKALHFTATRFKNNPEGRSALRNAYRAWYYKKRLEEIEAIGVERNLAGLPTLQVPQELLMPNAPADLVALRNDLEKMLADIRVDARVGVMVPNEDAGYRLGLLQGSGSTNATTADAIIQRYDRRILQVCLADFILLGGEAVGSYALADSKTSTFSKAVGAWATSIADEVNSSAVPPLFALNRGLPKFPKVTVLPRLVPGDVETRDLNLLAAFVTALAAVGYDVGGDANLEGYLRRVAGLPERIAVTPEGEGTTRPDQTPEPNEPAPGAEGAPAKKPEAAPGDTQPPGTEEAAGLAGKMAAATLDLDPDPADRLAVWKAADIRLTVAERRVRAVASTYVRQQYGAVVEALRREQPTFASPEGMEVWLRKALDAGIERTFRLGVQRALEQAMLPAAVAGARLARRVLKAAGHVEKAGRRIPVPRDFQRAATNYLRAKAFQGRLAEIGTRTQTRLRDVLIRGLHEGLDPEVVAERVNDALRLDSLSRAATIARTETLGAMNAAAMAGYEEAGAEGKEWLATPDERTRDPHAEANGQVVALADAFDVGGEELMFPGDPSGSPENIINCRCTVAPAAPPKEKE
jgi:SPP1 gp7 family putative phage head morphogenesis protein